MRREGESIIVEILELSPPNETIMSTEGRVARHFPASALAISLGTFQEEGLRAILTETIVRMSHQESAQVMSRSSKSGDNPIEIRDTTDPRLITDLLMKFLQATGQVVSLQGVWKNTRDDILWSKGLLPWRRSSTWLLARVAMQLLISRATNATTCYKAVTTLFMARILEIYIKRGPSAEQVHCMTCKIRQRLEKLGSTSPPPPWHVSIMDVVSNAVGYLQQRWALVNSQLSPSLDLSGLANLKPSADTGAFLPNLDAFAKSLLSPSVDGVETSFHAKPVFSARQSGCKEIPRVAPANSDEEPLFSLIEFEIWVGSELDTWLEANIDHENTIADLATVMREYHTHAFQAYEHNPESWSVMILTVLELWVGCDKVATKHYPMLLDYDPAIPERLLESLVLALRSDISRLAQIEAYLRQRRSKADPGLPSILFNFGAEKSFAVRHFRQSPTLKHLRRQIESAATIERREKVAELKELRREYDRLMSDYRASECTYVDKTRTWYGETVTERVHASWCHKHSLLRAAENMTIKIHEWPLPRANREACATIFELDCPPGFREWRDATIYILVDMFKCTYRTTKAAKFSYGLDDFLRRFKQPVEGRIHLNSDAKPHLKSHYSTLKVEIASENDICRHNGLIYAYLDATSNRYVTDTVVTEHVNRACTYQLQTSPSIQDFMYRPWFRPHGPAPNCVVSEQHACPEHMSLAEFRAFASVPLGTRLQWANILVQLVAPAVDFRKLDTYLLMLQVARQVGPAGTAEQAAREGHQDLFDPRFRTQLLEALREGLKRIRDNWESCQALATFVAIATKLLSHTATGDTDNSCLEYLADCRNTAVGWTRLVREKAASALGAQRSELLLRVHEISHICVSTFEVDEHHLAKIVQTTEYAAVLLECAIGIQETTQTRDKRRRFSHMLSEHRWKRLCLKVQGQLCRIICQQNDPSLDMAISRFWDGYRRGAPWRAAPSCDNHWLLTETLADADAASQSVQYNLLTGEFLVNGTPLSRLPKEYMSHLPYDLLFGAAAVEVLPSRRPGMRFEALKSHHCYKRYFGLQSDQSQHEDIVIICQTKNDVLTLVPNRLLIGRLPLHFSMDYMHWHRASTQTIEFRPLSCPWPKADPHWVLSKLGTSWTLKKQAEAILLIPPKSATTNMISRIFEAVESVDFLHVTWHTGRQELEVELPRLKLGFTMPQDSSPKLYSREFRGMHISRDTDLGTFVGLQSKIVLVNGNKEKMVLVPDGIVEWTRWKEQHTSVFISLGTSQRVHPYRIDERLGRVTDNGDMNSMLKRSYIHALTTGCVPDRLTSLTGTEQALEILHSAAVRSFRRLKKDEADLLRKIASLIPSREYYPKGKTVMQKVIWHDDLDALAQHAGLALAAKAILSQAENLSFLCGENLKYPDVLGGTNLVLLNRDSIRTSTFRRYRFGGEKHLTDRDVVYTSRKARGTGEADRAQLVCVAASRVFTKSPFRQSPVESGLAERMYQLLSGAPEMFGPQSRLAEDLIAFDARYLAQPWDLLARHWCTIHRRWQVQNQDGAGRYRTMMYLAALAFAGKVDAQVVQAILALATVPELRHMDIPQVGMLKLGNGREPNSNEVTTFVRGHLMGFCDSPDYRMARHADESVKAHQKRREDSFDENQKQAISAFVTGLVDQWPCKTPARPTNSQLPHYTDPDGVMRDVQPLFEQWWRNDQFYQYLQRLEQALRMVPEMPLSPSQLTSTPPQRPLPEPRPLTTDANLFSHPPPILEQPPRLDFVADAIAFHEQGTRGHGEDLRPVIDRLAQTATHAFQREYVTELRSSFARLAEKHASQRRIKSGKHLSHILASHLFHCKQHLELICRQLGMKACGLASTAKERQSEALTYNSPRASPRFFLRQLSRTSWPHLPPRWRDAIIAYGLAITAVQRAERLLAALHSSSDLTKELENVGHVNWQPVDFPDSLLIEIEGGILIREVQEEIAAHMRSPPDGGNSVMQLHMGEGKSSVIVPSISAALANGEQLLRIIVPRPQSRQMHQMLVCKLGGLVDRQVYHMPVSRSLKLSATQVRTILEMCEECMRTRGVLLVLPEHLLSFQLMGLESVILERETIAKPLLQAQRFFMDYARDIVDESDENFSVKFELVYTMGLQKSLEMGSQRWSLVQHVLRAILRIVPELVHALPSSIEVEQSVADNAFPRIRLLDDDSIALFQRLLADEICNSGLPGFPISRQPLDIRQAFREYMTLPDLSDAQIDAMEDSTFWTQSMIGPSLLLRGLLAGGILAFVFARKRWRVNYGLTTTRIPQTRLAVPYRAKDNPSPRSEFSHPDVVIALTCLAYYYGGLGDDDLFNIFTRLLKSDQADSVYAEWVQDCPDLPSSFRTLVGVNLKDRHQCTQDIFRHFRRSKAVIDYFLANIVFPVEMKEFPKKLSASGWDLGQVKPHPTTAFSGTSDSNHLLPLAMKYHNLPTQSHTNALVLQYLVQPDNHVELVPRVPMDNASRSDADHLLSIIIRSKHPVEVILDVGSQILEYTNIQMATRWLQLSDEIGGKLKEAAVFVDDDDELSVVDRNGNVEILQTSPYLKRLDSCLVFLDEAHTRGIDLRLPTHYRAAVTLGAGLTKDRIVQGKLVEERQCRLEPDLFLRKTETLTSSI